MCMHNAIENMQARCLFRAGNFCAQKNRIFCKCRVCRNVWTTNKFAIFFVVLVTRGRKRFSIVRVLTCVVCCVEHNRMKRRRTKTKPDHEKNQEKFRPVSDPYTFWEEDNNKDNKTPVKRTRREQPSSSLSEAQQLVIKTFVSGEGKKSDDQKALFQEFCLKHEIPFHRGLWLYRRLRSEAVVKQSVIRIAEAVSTVAETNSVASTSDIQSSVTTKEQTISVDQSVQSAPATPISVVAFTAPLKTHHRIDPQTILKPLDQLVQKRQQQLMALLSESKAISQRLLQIQAAVPVVEAAVSRATRAHLSGLRLCCEPTQPVTLATLVSHVADESIPPTLFSLHPQMKGFVSVSAKQPKKGF